MIILSRRKVPLTPEQRTAIEDRVPADYRAYFWLNGRGQWTCQIFPPVTTWGTSGPSVAQARHEWPFAAFLLAAGSGAVPREEREYATFRGVEVEVV
jgi:hypothetical protein